MNLLIHNCNVYRVKESTRKTYESELFKIENMSKEKERGKKFVKEILENAN